MAINEIKPFGASGTTGAIGSGSDALTVAAYTEDPHRLIGHQPGIARRELENTVLRQTSHMAAGVAQFVSSRYAPGVVDDGDLTKVETGLAAAVDSLIGLHNASDLAHPDIRALIAALGAERYETMWIGAGAMIPNKTNGATAKTTEYATSLLNLDILEFGAAADTSAEVSLMLPRNWDLGVIRVRPHWVPGAVATTGHYVGWMISGRAYGDSDNLGLAMGTPVTVADQVGAATTNLREHICEASGEITIAGPPAAGDRISLRVTRDVDYAGGGTAMPVAAWLLGVEIQYRVTGTPAAW